MINRKNLILASLILSVSISACSGNNNPVTPDAINQVATQSNDSSVLLANSTDEVAIEVSKEDKEFTSAELINLVTSKDSILSDKNAFTTLGIFSKLEDKVKSWVTDVTPSPTPTASDSPSPSPSDSPAPSASATPAPSDSPAPSIIPSPSPSSTSFFGKIKDKVSTWIDNHKKEEQAEKDKKAAEKVQKKVNRVIKQEAFVEKDPQLAKDLKDASALKGMDKVTKLKEIKTKSPTSFDTWKKRRDAKRWEEFAKKNPDLASDLIDISQLPADQRPAQIEALKTKYPDFFNK